MKLFERIRAENSELAAKVRLLEKQVGRVVEFAFAAVSLSL